MKTEFKKALILLVVIFTSLFVRGQDKKTDAESFNDYVITVNGDKLICQVNLPAFGAPNYRTEKMSETKKIKPDEIKEYYTAKSKVLMRAIVVEGIKKMAYWPVVENGKINLYQSPYTSQFTTIWYVSKGVDTAYLLKTNDIIAFTARKDRQNRFEEMLKDNPAAYNRFLALKKFTYPDILSIVHQYNTGN